MKEIMLQNSKFKNQFYHEINNNYKVPDFRSISKIVELTKKFKNALEKEGYKFKDPDTIVHSSEEKITVICAGKNFTNTKHEYEICSHAFTSNKSRCPFCKSPKIEDIINAFKYMIKDVLFVNIRKREKYVQYTCYGCNNVRILSMGNFKQAVNFLCSRKICTDIECNKINHH